MVGAQEKREAVGGFSGRRAGGPDDKGEVALPLYRADVAKNVGPAWPAPRRLFAQQLLIPFHHLCDVEVYRFDRAVWKPDFEQIGREVPFLAGDEGLPDQPGARVVLLDPNIFLADAFHRHRRGAIMNRAAEKAVPQAANILGDAVRNMAVSLRKPRMNSPGLSYFVR